MENKNIRITTTIYPEGKGPPVYVPPALEPVVFSMPNDLRKDTLTEFMTGIGKDHMIEHVWNEVKDYNPLHSERQDRMGYTKEQRLWVKGKRDEWTDQAPYPHITSKEQLRKFGLMTQSYIEAINSIELHHIFPQSFCQAFLGLSGDKYNSLVNSAENGISLSRISHTGPYIAGVNESRHPEMDRARILYNRWPESIKVALSNHWELAKEGIKFWVSDNDQKMFEIARTRTERMRAMKRGGNNGK